MDYEKLSKIKEIVEDFEKQKCPYCHKTLHKFLNRDEVAYGCDSNEVHVDDLHITDYDYINCISNIIKFGINKFVNFKNLGEF